MRKPAVLLTIAALVVGAAVATPFAQSASATSAGVAFSGDDLPTWQTNGVVYGMAAARGKVVVGGTFSQLRPPTGASGTARTQNALAILNGETGQPDSCQFPVSLAGGTATVRTVVASPDGSTVFIGGNFSSVGGVTVSRIAAIDPATCQVKAFRVPAVSSLVYGLVATPDTLYVAGAFRTVGGQTRERFAAVNATSGALLPWAPAADVTGRAVAISPDRTKVAIGGDFASINGQDSRALAIVDASNGATVRTYPSGFFLSTTSVNKTLWSDGTTLYGGNEGTGGNVFDGRFAIDWNTLDQKWRDNCLGATQAVLTHNGTLYSASHAHDCSSNRAFQDGSRKYFLAQTTADATILGWFPTANDGTGEGIGPRAMTVATGPTTNKDYLWYGGEFTAINGKAQQGLTRFGPDDVGAPPTPAVVAEALTSNSLQIRFRTVVDPDDGLLTYRVFRNGATAPIWTGTATSQWWTRPQVTVVDNDVVAGTNYTYRVTASDGVNTSALSSPVSARPVSKAVDYPSQVIADGASLYWRLGEASGPWAQDKSGATTAGINGLYKNGYTLGAAGAIAGSSDTAVTFDGSTGYLWSDQQIQGPSTYSVETWIKTSTTRGGKVVGFGDGRPRTDNGNLQQSDNYDRHIYMDNAGRLTFGTYSGSVNAARSSASYNDDQWHHVVATQGSNGMRLYVDGVRVAQNSATSAQDYRGNWHVGGDQLNGWPEQPSSNFFAGQIDDTAVYAAVLTPGQVAQHYTLAGGTVSVPAAPIDAYGARVFNDEAELYWRMDEASGSVAKDSSTTGESPGMVGNAVVRQQSPAIRTGSSVALNGSNDAVVSSQSAATSPVTYSAEAWFNSSSQVGGKILGFEDAQTGNGGNYDRNVYLTNSGEVVYGVYVGYVPVIATAPGYNDGRWHHVVATQGATGMALYIDGALVGTNDVTGNQSFTGYWRVGGGNLGGWPGDHSINEFAGGIDEVAVYGRALTASEVASHYTLGTTTAPVPDMSAPSGPGQLSATASGDTVTLAWQASTDDVGVTGYSVYRGASADFTADASTKLADVTVTSYSDAALTPATYYYKVVAFDAAGNTSTAASASAEVIPPADTAAPSAPAEVNGAASGSTATVSWNASTDNVGVVGYRVYRGSSAGFAADASTKVADASGNSFTDSGLLAGNYYYRVDAVDAAGNASAASSAVEVTIASAPVPPTVITVAVTEDARVAKIAPTTNYGTDSQLASTGETASSPLSSYLRFALPAAPAGKKLTGATLQLRTSTDPSAGSADAHAVRVVTGDWNQSTVTWNTRPTGPGPLLGSLTGATAVNTAYAVTLDATQLSTLSGSQAFSIIGVGTDNLRIWSNEASNASYRPTLTLTYTAG